MFNISNYKTIVIKRTVKRCIIFSCCWCVLFMILCLFNYKLLYFMIISLLPIIYMIVRIYRIFTYDIALGEIVEVTLENKYDDPYTCAVIEFQDKLSDKKYKTVRSISHWGDYEEEFEQAINEMLEEDKTNIGKKIPVLYKKNDPNNDPNNCIIYLRDLFLDE